MNREIKFRAWDTRIKKIFSWEEYVDREEYDYFSGIGVSMMQVILNKSGSYIPMQYTGLKDKNGKEIYEGDIVKQENETNDRVYEVRFFKDLKWDGGGSPHPGFYFNMSKYDRDESLRYDLGFDDIEIIGNVWENSDLLK